MIKEGVYAAGLSVLNEDTSLNTEATIFHAEKIIKKGLHGVFFFGSTGQSQLISISEKKDLISKLDTLRAKDDTQIVLSPYRGMKSRIALTSWRHVQFLDEFNEDTITEFIKAYRDRAPESWIGNYWGDAIQ